MIREFINSYNEFDFNPPAPVLDILLESPDPFLPKNIITIKRMALLDTGADLTAIPEEVVGQLGLKKIDDIIVSDYKGNFFRTAVFAVHLIIKELIDSNIRVITSTLDYVHLGRDILNQWKLYLDASNKIIRIN
ncbi:MAG: hypothetical protein FJW61_00660 [Actinobacteria bacterium]|nr:hypothetical protein [Actinomycetota bacterium]